MSLDIWLKNFLSEHGAVAGTVHYLKGDALELAASLNIPPPVVLKTQTIPRGKGMAGLAWERNEIVSTCNLKTDQSGDVRPGARAVDARAAAAIPVHDRSGAVRAVVGIAYADDRELDAEQRGALARAAEALPSDA